MFDVDSPGGSVSMVPEMAAEILADKGQPDRAEKLAKVARSFAPRRKHNREREREHGREREREHKRERRSDSERVRDRWSHTFFTG